MRRGPASPLLVVQGLFGAFLHQMNQMCLMYLMPGEKLQV